MNLVNKLHDPIADNEFLFRSVRLNDGYRYENGQVRISSSAFNDRKQQPSVDRAILINHDPCKSQKSIDDCVVSLLTKTLREERVDRSSASYMLDAHPDPLPHNVAHAIIISSPEYRNDKDFRKVKESLARLAKLELVPELD